jgi:cytochrome c
MVPSLSNAQQKSADNNTKSDIEEILFNFGRPATTEEIKKWNLDVRPDGTGLPLGEGSVSEGEILYSTKCAFCHGVSGQGGINERLVAYEDEDFPQGIVACGFECRTIGNYWPYATTLYDYILRSMPMNAPGSLTFNEVYALSAYLLYLNNIVPDSTKLSASSLKEIVMPAHDKFVPDDRLEYNMVH